MLLLLLLPLLLSHLQEGPVSCACTLCCCLPLLHGADLLLQCRLLGQQPLQVSLQDKGFSSMDVRNWLHCSCVGTSSDIQLATPHTATQAMPHMQCYAFSGLPCNMVQASVQFCHLCVDAVVERVLHCCQAALLGLQLSRPARRHL
jgi:hypothetical protein